MREFWVMEMIWLKCLFDSISLPPLIDTKSVLGYLHPCSSPIPAIIESLLSLSSSYLDHLDFYITAVHFWDNKMAKKLFIRFVLSFSLILHFSSSQQLFKCIFSCAQPHITGSWISGRKLLEEIVIPAALLSPNYSEKVSHSN